MSQYFGKTISLISNKGLRYVGLLDKISAEDATVSLKSVRLFGTEGRMAEQGQAGLEVMPGTDVYEYVVFRGSDVKDLTVMDLPIEEVRPVTYFPPSNAQQGSLASATTAQSAPSVSGPTPLPSANQGYANQNFGPRTTRESAPTPVSASPNQSAAPPRETGCFYRPGNRHSGPKPTPTSTGTQTPTRTSREAPKERSALEVTQTYNTAFDFEEANKRFEKERLQEGASRPTYDKSLLFFDTISLNEYKNSMRWNEEKNLNMDTFGEAYAHRGRVNYRGGRGRGNGYGGRGRGNCRGRGSSEPKPEWA